jgi:hypothetical protein
MKIEASKVSVLETKARRWRRGVGLSLPVEGLWKVPAALSMRGNTTTQTLDNVSLQGTLSLEIGVIFWTEIESVADSIVKSGKTSTALAKVQEIFTQYGIAGVKS